jgi:hypothetical protein
MDVPWQNRHDFIGLIDNVSHVVNEPQDGTVGFAAACEAV